MVVDDSIFFRKVLIDKLSEFPNLEIIGYAVDAFDAGDKIPVLNPDVVTMDVEMPRLNGIEFLKQLLPAHSVPVVLVSSLNINVFDALSAGAVDFVKKPDISQPNATSLFIKELAGKITIASAAKVRTSSTVNPSKEPPVITMPKSIQSLSNSSLVIAIGASTGGTEAILTVLKELPEDTPGILVVQHMPAGFTKMYAERLNRICKMEVKEAVNGDIVKKGLVLIAPGDFHMALVKKGTQYSVKCYNDVKVSGHRPSVDVLFDSVAQTAGKNSIGIILTGMGRDGAAGLLKMRKSGAYTIGQDKESCVVYGMPMEAYNLGAVMIQAPCEEIPSIIRKQLTKI